MTRQLTDVTVIQGRTARLECGVVADSHLKVRWLHNGLPIFADLRRTMTCSGGSATLEIRDVSQLDSGAYTCEVSNAQSGDLDMTSAQLRVAESPRIHVDSGLASGEPITCHSGGSLRIEVRITGSPSPTISWAKDGRQLATDGRIFVDASESPSSSVLRTSLVINNLKPEDSGRLILRASNEAGDEVQAFVITVLDVPTAPGGPLGMQLHPAGRAVTLSWTEPINNGGCPITRYLIERRELSSGDSWRQIASVGARTHSYTLTLTSSDDEFWLRVRAVNDVGAGEGLEATQPVRPLPNQGSAPGIFLLREWQT